MKTASLSISLALVTNLTNQSPWDAIVPFILGPGFFCKIFLLMIKQKHNPRLGRQDIKHVKVGRSCLISIYLLKIKQLLYLCNRNIYILLYSRTTLFVACFVDRMILMVRIVKKNTLLLLTGGVLTLRIQMHLINFIFKHIKYKA